MRSLRSASKASLNYVRRFFGSQGAQKDKHTFRSWLYGAGFAGVFISSITTKAEKKEVSVSNQNVKKIATSRLREIDVEDLGSLEMEKPEHDVDDLQNEWQENSALIALADEFRESLELPQQSLFRSVAVLVYEDINGVRRHIVGSNCEVSCFIQNSISAERSALAQLAKQGGFAKIAKIVIATDSPLWRLPGPSSREFLASTCDPETSVVICGSKNQNDYFLTSVGDIYPHPNIYSSLDRLECILFASHVGDQLERPTEKDSEELYYLARLAAKRDANEELHPLSLGAAVLFEDGTTEFAWQQKNAEYASSLDPVSLLAMALEKKKLEGIKPKKILQVDQFGILHAPVAAARSFLVSHGYSQVQILVHDCNGKLSNVTPKELLPQIPAILGFDPNLTESTEA